MSAAISISGRFIGKGTPVYLIAELSAHHNQDFGEAVGRVEAAKQAGADAVKLQTYTPDTITIAGDQKYFRIGGGTLWDGRNRTTSTARRTHPGNGSPSSSRWRMISGSTCSRAPLTTRRSISWRRWGYLFTN
jgi:NeuB family